VTFGFVARARRPAGLRGARLQAVSGESSYVEIGWNPWGMLPQLLPQGEKPVYEPSRECAAAES
jgi:hypothetical protein